MSKRGREEMEQPQTTTLLKQLVDLCAQRALTAEQKRIAERNAEQARRQAAQTLAAAHLRSLPLAEREIVFKAVLACNQSIVDRMVTSCAKSAGTLGQSAAAAAVVAKQIDSIRALNWVIVAEAASVCAVMSDADDNNGTEGSGSLKHVSRVVRDEISRVGSAFMVFELLQVMLRELDADLEAKRLNLLVGSLLVSMQTKFRTMRAMILKQRASGAHSTAPSSPAPACPLADSDDKEKPQQPQQQQAKVWPASSGQLAGFFACAARESKRARV